MGFCLVHVEDMTAVYLARPLVKVNGVWAFGKSPWLEAKRLTFVVADHAGKGHEEFNPRNEVVVFIRSPDVMQIPHPVPQGDHSIDFELMRFPRAAGYMVAAAIAGNLKVQFIWNNTDPNHPVLGAVAIRRSDSSPEPDYLNMNVGPAILASPSEQPQRHFNFQTAIRDTKDEADAERFVMEDAAVALVNAMCVPGQQIYLRYTDSTYNSFSTIGRDLNSTEPWGPIPSSLPGHKTPWPEYPGPD